ncbi:hypothetical protein H5410_024250 [Solanum commersonii]|uniref:Uncharacterized protein n=1 Tax=Solanum commersonii TaxID=4109 RepID=A0A9J5ZLE9_SOLCO|nr:hypothetical protein H5410_024250 [Solanum commersonii]
MNRIVLAIDVDEQHLRQANGHATEVVSLMIAAMTRYNMIVTTNSYDKNFELIQNLILALQHVHDVVVQCFKRLCWDSHRGLLWGGAIAKCIETHCLGFSPVRLTF